MALWMNLGTINVVNGSKAVTGVGTKFKTAPIPAREGQPIVINNVHYEIGSVNSDTSITLALNYAGATANSLPYTIITTAEGSFNDLSRRAAQVMSLYQGYMDVYDALFSGTGNVTVTLPDGDVVTLPAWNTMQPKDATLTSLSGKPVKSFGMARLNDQDAAAALTALGASTFGRARLADNNAAAQRSALGTKSAALTAVLGTVTKPDGDGATGAIVEFGSNANGYYLKLAGGLLICFGSFSFLPSAAGTAAGSMFRSLSPGIMFPVLFSGVVDCVIPVQNRPNQDAAMGFNVIAAKGSGYFNIHHISVSAGPYTVIGEYIAIGRWY